MLRPTDVALPFHFSLQAISVKVCLLVVPQSDNRTVTSMADLQDHPDWVVRTCEPSRYYAVPGTVP